MFCTKKIRFVALLLLFAGSSCMYEGPSEITKDIEGTYKYRYPSGQVEVLGIRNDYTFSQAIYANENDYVTGKALYKNGGTWTYRGVKLEFEHWLSISEFGRNVDSILPKPDYSGMMGVSWYAPTDEHKGQIDVYSENGYVLEQIDK